MNSRWPTPWDEDEDNWKFKFQDTDSIPDADLTHKKSETSPLETDSENISYHQLLRSCIEDIYRNKKKIEDLEKHIAQLEETSLEKRKFLKRMNNLLLISMAVLVILPIISFASLAIVQYIFYGESNLLHVNTAVIGVINVAACILMPLLWKHTSDKVDKLEDKLDR